MIPPDPSPSYTRAPRRLLGGSRPRTAPVAYRGAVPVREQELSGAPADDGTTSARPAWIGIGGAWLVSRVLSVVTLLVAVQDPGRGSRFDQLATKWDGAFYLEIARSGYGPVDVPFPRWPFFPGLPGALRLLGELGDDRALLFVGNQLVFLAALVGLYQLARRHGGHRVAMLAVWALALFPASFVFSMTYPSAIFLAASVWGFLLVERRTVGGDVGAGLLAAVAASVRPNGLVVAAALVVAVWWSWRRVCCVAGPALLLVAAWCWYCYDRTGDALVFLTTKSRWQEITFVGLFEGHVKWSIVPHVLLAVAAIVIVVVQWRRLPLSWLVLVGLSLVPSLQLGMVGVGRYANECFPPFVAAGQVLERWRTRNVIAVYCLSALGLVAFAFVSGRYELVP